MTRTPVGPPPSLITRTLAVSPADAGKMIGVDPRTLRNWDVAGIGPPSKKVGGRRLYAVAEFERWLTDTTTATD